MKNLDDHHLSKLIVYLVKSYEKENPILFKGRADGGLGPKFKHIKSEMLGL